MNNWKSQLREADPLRGAERVALTDAEAMRRLVVTAAREADALRVAWWPSAVALAATIVVVVAVGALTGTRLADTEAPAGGGAVVLQPAHVRQMQFETPGGTRIIWIFNQDLNLNETMP